MSATANAIREKLAELAGHPDAEATRAALNEARKIGALDEAVLLRALRRLQGLGPAPLLQVPDGRYAIAWPPSATGNMRLLGFFWVDHPARGRFAGALVVKKLRGGKGWQAFPQRQWGDVFDIILEVGVEEAGQAYAREQKKCRLCGRALELAESRARGIGPECRRRLRK